MMTWRQALSESILVVEKWNEESLSMISSDDWLQMSPRHHKTEVTQTNGS